MIRFRHNLGRAAVAVFNLTTGTDRLIGGNGVADEFVIDAAGELQTADTVAGGTGSVTDVLTISFAGTYRFNQATASAMLVGIELIDIASGATALYIGSGSTLTNAAFLRVNGGRDGDIVAMVPNQVTPPASPFGLWIEGNGGADSLYGTGFGDTLFGGDDADLLVGHAGDDHGDAGAGGATMDGGTGGDTLVGGAGHDGLVGREGNDLLLGAGGNDLMSGGDGADSFDGGEGNDTFLGEGNGADTAFGGVGDDLLEAGADGSVLVAGTGNNTLRGGKGADWALSDGGGEDRFDSAGEGDDVWLVLDYTSGTWDAGGGNDYMNARYGRNVMLAGDGNDTLLGSGADSMQGGEGNDVYLDAAELSGLPDGGRADVFDGGAGNDTLRDGPGNDTMLGGDGADLFSGTGLFYTNLPALDLRPGFPTFSYATYSPAFAEGGDDSFDGGSGADTFSAGGGHDSFDGGRGDDLFIAGNGDDSFLGGEGADLAEIFGVYFGGDTLDGGVGLDRLVLIGSTTVRFGTDGVPVSGFEVVEGKGTGALRLVFAGSDAATVLGMAGADRLDARGQAIAMWIEGRAGNDTAIGGAAADTLSGGADNDSLAGLAGADSIAGEAGGDSLDGGSSADTLDGGEGNDRIAGGGGADLLRIGTGNDTALGGTGADTVEAALAALDAADLLAGGEGADLLALTARGGDILLPATATRLSGFEHILLERLGGEGAVFFTVGDTPVDSIAVPLRVELRGSLLHVDGSGVTGTGFLGFGGGQSTLLGGAGADTFTAGSEGSRLEGRSGDDLLVLGAGADTAWGGGDNDLILAGGGSFGAGDTVSGDAGTDTLRFTAAGASPSPPATSRVCSASR
jgi:Ca2+-binding RTX toxin-like protein